MYLTENLEYNKAFILGNGFDKANGHPTSYGEFAESSTFKRLLSCDNQLAKHIWKKHTESKWLDIEVEIGEYSYLLGEEYKGNAFSRETDRFEQEFISLNDALYRYIDNIRSGTTNPRMEDLVKNWKNSLFGEVQEKAFFVTFNYLRWDTVILQEMMVNSRFVGGYPLFVHGMTRYDESANPKIVLGVDEKSKHCKAHKFIVKAYNPYSKADVYFKHIYDANEITIFGCSIGDTDQRYFSSLFSQAKGKTFKIYYFGSKEEFEINANIAAICDLDKFKIDNIVKFEDSSKFST